MENQPNAVGKIMDLLILKSLQEYVAVEKTIYLLAFGTPWGINTQHIIW